MKPSNAASNYRIGCLAVLIGICTVLPAAALCEDKRTQSAASVPLEDQYLQEQILVHVYFADEFGHYLQAEERMITATISAVEKGRIIIRAIIKGPRSDLTRTIPSETQLNAFYVGQGGRAYVDLSEEIMNNSPGGCRTEILTVYSIVNSLILNIPEIESVKILVNGSETPTVAGHIDSRYAYTSDMLLIR